MTATILVADDYDDARELLQIILERAGYRVVTARDGAEAFRLAGEHHPAAAILDLFMPVQDGLETARQFKADPILRHLPLIAYSANLHALGEDFPFFAARLPKPCPPEQLVATVRAATRGESG